MFGTTEKREKPHPTEPPETAALHDDARYQPKHAAAEPDSQRTGTRRQRRKERLDSRPTMSGWLSALVAIAGSLLITFVCFFIQTDGSWTELADIYPQRPLVLLLNGLVVLAFTMLIGTIFASSFGGLATSMIVFGGLGIANVIKVELRDEPVVFADLGLIKEVGNAAEGYSIDLHPPLIALLAVCAVIFILLAKFVRSWHPAKRRTRVIASVCSAALFVAMFPLVFSNDAIYQYTLDRYLDSTNQYNFSAVCKNVGFNYYFAHSVDLNEIDKPSGYHKKEVESWISEHDAAVAASSTTSDSSSAETAVAASGVQPNIIFVMCESFTDLSDEEEFAYSEQDDPLAGFKRVCSSDGALVSGHIVVSNYGGGTANTEFDVTTGMKTNFISDKNPTAFYCLHRATNSLFRAAEESGYTTAFMHPGYSWFYNRQNVYKMLGVQYETFNEAFTSDDMLGGWITDEAFLRQLEQDFQELTQDSDQPLLYYGVTIQNHLQYEYGKYVYEGTEYYDPVPLDVEISDESMEPLAVYMRGVRDSSEMISELTDYLDTVDEPTIVVFFGDHRPNLGADYSVYRELGSDVGLNDTPENTIETYSTPYVIWANKSYCSLVDTAQAVEELDMPEGNLISDNYLGAVAYELAGLSGTDAYFDFLNEARRVVPVICRGNYLTSDGTYTNSLNDEQQEIVDKLRKWEYYRLCDEEL
jgi:phosphoglycerol transferase MdoB-like AlkP superfamily enzyme